MASEPAAAATLKGSLDDEISGLQTERYSWWVHWSQLATYILPRRYRWLVTPNQMNRGSAINGAIIDSTGTIAARVLASGMMSGITSPTRPWFRLRVPGYSPDEINAVNVWLAECERRMLHVFQESNFYNAIAVMYMDLAVFGTAPMLIYENYENVICCYNPCAGEYYVWNDTELKAGGLAREITMTVPQLIKEFGEENCSLEVQLAWKQKGAPLTREIVVRHIIKPNTENHVASKFKWFEAYWERGSVANGQASGGADSDKFLRKRGFYEAPFICPRWETSGNDAYGRSVAMDALGDIKQLQQETKRKAQAIDKLANPPMVADVELKNQPASTLPGGVTYVTKKEGVGFTPAYQNFRPPVGEMMQDLTQIQKRIKDIFFNDLFLMISNLETVRTATEIDARKEEKLIMLGPVLERLQTEGQDPVIDRVFAIMQRGGLLPPPPPEIAGAPIAVEYVSMLAEAQRVSKTVGIERFLAQIGNVAAIDPNILDIPNFDRLLTRYGAILGNDPTDINTPEEIAQIRTAKQQAARQQQLADTSQGFAKAGKTLSETNVGGGVNALQAMIGGAPG